MPQKETFQTVLRKANIFLLNQVFISSFLVVVSRRNPVLIFESVKAHCPWYYDINTLFQALVLVILQTIFQSFHCPFCHCSLLFFLNQKYQVVCSKKKEWTILLLHLSQIHRAQSICWFCYSTFWGAFLKVIISPLSFFITKSVNRKLAGRCWLTWFFI